MSYWPPGVDLDSADEALNREEVMQRIERFPELTADFDVLWAKLLEACDFMFFCLWWFFACGFVCLCAQMCVWGGVDNQCDLIII